MQRQNGAQHLDDLAQQANQLAQQQGDFQNRLRKLVGSSPGESQRFGAQGLQSQQDAERMASEKTEMADKLKKLEQGMQDTARSMAGSQNPVGNKLREALGEAQQNELEMHMRQNAQWIRQGYGSSAWVRENTVTQGLNSLRDQLQQAQAAMQQQNGKPGEGPGGDNSDVEKALARVEAMRNRLEQAQGQQGKGKQPGPGREGQNGQGRESGALQRGNQSSGSQQSGQQPGGQQPGGQQPGQGGQQGQGQQGQNGQSGQSGNGGQAGSNASAYAPYGGGGPVTPGNGSATESTVPMEQAYRESLRDLNQLRDFIRQNPDVAGDYSNLSRALNPGYTSNDAELSQRLSHEVLPEVERLELELRRKLEDKNSDQVRSAGSETVPPGYSDAVADYFRKLSKGK
jgi:FtsZ-binding cell division protein ZapB